jgi:hypothetical protein
MPTCCSRHLTTATLAWSTTSASGRGRGTSVSSTSRGNDSHLQANPHRDSNPGRLLYPEHHVELAGAARWGNVGTEERSEALRRAAQARWSRKAATSGVSTRGSEAKGGQFNGWTVGRIVKSRHCKAWDCGEQACPKCRLAGVTQAPRESHSNGTSDRQYLTAKLGTGISQPRTNGYE